MEERPNCGHITTPLLLSKVVLVLEHVGSPGLKPCGHFGDDLLELNDPARGIQLAPAVLPENQQILQLLVHLVQLGLYHYLVGIRGGRGCNEWEKGRG